MKRASWRTRLAYDLGVVEVRLRGDQREETLVIPLTREKDDESAHCRGNGAAILTSETRVRTERGTSRDELHEMLPFEAARFKSRRDRGKLGRRIG